MQRKDRKSYARANGLLEYALPQRGRRSPAAGEEDRKPRGNKGRPRVGKNQCAYCKEEGHWVKACPRKAARGHTKVWKQRDMDSD